MLRNILPVILMFSLAAAGCATMETTEDSGPSAAAWTNGLTQRQILEAMPVTVTPTSANDVAPAGVIAPRRLMSAGDGHVISWRVPENSLSGDSWNIYESNDGETWTAVNTAGIDIAMATMVEDEVTYEEYSLVLPVTDTGAFVKYYKVMMQDLNNEEYGNIVSLVTYPGGHPLTVTLADETEAGAQSGVKAIYNDTPTDLWAVQQLQDVPVENRFIDLEASLDAWSDLQLIVNTDFSTYGGFSDAVLERPSNSSFCRVELVEPPGGPIVARLKYSFEDLPLRRLAFEAGRKFDYDDVVLYVDILEPVMATEPGKLLWARDSDGNYGTDYTWDTVTFDDGAAVAVGHFINTIVFGAGEANETVLSGRGGFVNRYNPDGTLAWSKGAANVEWRGVDRLVDGSILAVGYFWGTTVLGADESGETVLTSTRSRDGIIAKYNALGALEWAKQVSGSESISANSIATFSDGAFAISGYYYRDISFGVGIGFLNSTGNDGFVARYDSDGNAEWAKRFDPAYGMYSNFNHLAAYDDGSLVISDYFYGTMAVDGVVLSAGGTYSSCLIRYNSDGTLADARADGLDDHIYLTGVTGTADGASLVTGYFYKNVTLGAGEPNQTVLTSDNNYTNIFIARYNSLGVLEWAKQIGTSSGNEIAYDVSARSDGAFAIAGYFNAYNAPLVIGVGEANETTLSYNSGWDLLVATFAADGALQWATSAGGTYTDQGFALSVTDTGFLTVAGRFDSRDMTIGEGTENLTILENPGSGWDMFIAQYNM